ncbi:unnamed protein product, partial [Effrenium voratum]
NRQQGIGFNYGDSRRRRSRSPKKGEEVRKQQREKRKALFAAPVVKPAESKATPESDDEPDELDAPSLVSAPSGNSWEKAAWERSRFEDQEEKAKFLRLMGSKEKPKEESDKAQGLAAPGPSQQDLETQFLQGMQKQLYSRGRGLG